jgi:hypothetical protein
MGARLVKHARYYWLLLAEGRLNRRRFAATAAHLHATGDRRIAEAVTAEKSVRKI